MTEAISPGVAQLLQQAQSLEQLGRAAEAIGVYQQLLTLRADLPDAWFNLARLYRMTGQFPNALVCYQRALERGISQPEEAHLNRAVIYSDCLRQYAEAERELTRALHLNPTYVAALLNLGNLHEDLGHAAEARAAYERILALQPDNVDALARYAGMRAFDSDADPLIERLKVRFAAPELAAAERATVGFALGRALDSCGAYSAAFQVYTAANRYSRASAAPGTGYYDRAAQERFIDRLIEAFPGPDSAPSLTSVPELASASSWASASGSAPAPRQAATGPQPIFICGMFRSGSTLVERLIASQPDIAGGGELEFLPNLVRNALPAFPESVAQLSPGALESLAAQYLQALAARFPNTGRVTDKRPDNFLYVGLIKRLFPTARIVHTRRDPLDNCLSIYFLHLDQRMSYALDLDDIGHYYIQYRRLMQHWKKLYGADIHDVDYDSYVRQPDEEARRLFEFLQTPGPWAPPSAAAPVRTASVWQVREPLYQRSSGRARNYAIELEALRKYLQL